MMLHTGTLESTTLASSREVRSQVSRAGDRVTATITNEDGDVISASINEHGNITVTVRCEGGRVPVVREVGGTASIRVVRREAPTPTGDR